MDFFTWNQTERIKTKLHWNYTRILRAVCNKSWKQHLQIGGCTTTCLSSHKPFKSNKQDVLEEWGQSHKRSSLLDSCYWTPQCWRSSKDWLTSVLCGHNIQHRRHTRSNGWKKWMVSESGDLVLPAEHDDYIYHVYIRICIIYIYIYIYKCLCVCDVLKRWTAET